jgi:iron(III) transport system permease protein
VGPLVVLAPLASTILEASGIDASDAAELLFRPLVGELLVNTLGLVVVVALLAGVIGTACAWCVERTDLPGGGVWGVLTAAPLAVPPFISSYAWISISARLEGFWGALLVITCAYTPFVFLPVSAALRGLDPALEETARTLGHGPWRCFVRVVLPQLRPALLGGMLLVALNTLVEFGAFTLLRFRTFTTELYAEYRTGTDGAESALVACVLIALCLVCLTLELRVRSTSRYGRVARFAGRRPPRAPLGLWRAPALGFLAALNVAALAVPIGMVLFWLTQRNAAAVTTVAATVTSVMAALGQSLLLGVAGAAVTIVLGFPLAILAARYNGSVITVLERMAWLAQGVPGIVVALALVTLTLDVLPGLYQTTLLLVLAYAVLFLPLALVSMRAALMQAQPRIEDVGRTLGLGWAAVTWRLTLPIAGPGLGAAAALVFVSVVTELTATLLLSPAGTETLATQVWADTSTLAFAAAAPYGALMVACSLGSTWIMARRFGRAAFVGA